MQIAIITVHREPCYLYDTLIHLYQSELDLPDVHLFVGSPEEDYLYGVKVIAPHIHVHSMPPEVWNRIKGVPVQTRAAANFLQALDSGSGDLMLFEDDVAIKPGWMTALAPFRDGRHIVSLYVHQAVAVTGTDPVPHYDYAAGQWLQGSLGIFVPAKHRLGLADLLRVRHREGAPFDSLLNVYARQTATKLVATLPSYVDHRGEVSAIPNNRSHGSRRSPMF